MRAELFVVTQRGNLAPATGRARDGMAGLKLKPGDFVACKVCQNRNPRLNALVHVVISKLADATGVPEGIIKTKLKRALGLVDFVERDGRVVESPKSLASISDEMEFREFWLAAEELICGEVLPELDPDVQDEILTIMEGHKPR